jgi:hypothetical protein
MKISIVTINFRGIHIQLLVLVILDFTNISRWQLKLSQVMTPVEFERAFVVLIV